MRRIIFILMIALLPLRGWMGEAMATEMATINLIATQAINTTAKIYLNDINSMHDCDMHQSTSQDDPVGNQTCSNCQLCHISGVIETVRIISDSHLSHATPQAYHANLTSADLQLTQKPPIL